MQTPAIFLLHQKLSVLGAAASRLPVHTGMHSKIKVSSKALFLAVSVLQCEGAECFSALILLFAQQDDPESRWCIL